MDCASIMAAELQITLCEERDSNAWDEYVEESPAATVSHLLGWRRIISCAYGHRSYYLMARRGNDVVGVLPLVWIKNLFFGNVLSSMPYQDYGGVAADDDYVASALLEHALNLRRSCNASCLELRQRDYMVPGKCSLRNDKTALLLDISQGVEAQWKLLDGKVRNQIRKAQRSGLCTQLGGAELLEEFYPVFASNMRDLGSPVHHPAFFSSIFLEFAENARLLVVREGQRVIGGLVCLFHKDVIIVPWASSLREFLSKCPNNLLYWDAIQLACERGCKWFDFGRSSIGSGTYNYKLQWGAKPVQLNWQFFHHKDDKYAGLPRGNAKYQLALWMWKHMPVSATLHLGPHIRKYLTL
jgi:serine/alanine adding enzyme